MTDHNSIRRKSASFFHMKNSSRILRLHTIVIMKLICNLTFLLVATLTHAQFATDRVLIENHITKPSCVKTVDINNDGEKDILTYSTENKRLAWNRRNCSIDDWESSIVISRYVELTTMVTSDIDLDGDNDIIAAESLNNNIIIYRNSGLGNFDSPEILIENEQDIVHIELADLDNDGDLDLVVSSKYQKTVAWFTNSNGFGFFQNKTIITSQLELAREVIAADVDGDNDLDLIASGKNKIIWFENTNEGSFNAGTSIGTESPSNRIQPLDFDYDGDIDIITGSFTTKEINLYENQDGAGSYGDPILLVNYPDIYGMYVEDLDGDNDYDIIVSSYDKEDEIVYFTQLDIPLTFSEKNEISSESGVFSFEVTDMNKDSTPDFVVPRYHDSEIIVVANHIAEKDSIITHRVDLGTNSICSIITTDLDQDGFLDILSASDKLLWHRNLGEGNLNFEEIQLIPSTPIHDCKVFDGDNDNDMDIYYSTPLYVFWLNNENGVFNEKYIGWGQHFAIGDINGDSYIDIVRAKGDIFWHLGAENETAFDSFNVITNNFSSVRTIELFDFDNDQDLDIICGSIQNNGVYWFENLDGQGNFGEPVTIVSEIKHPSDITFGDIDGDSDTDLIIADFANGEFILFKNINGSNEYEDFVKINTDIAGAHSVALADFDNDGDLDIVGTQFDQGDVLWLVNNGIGVFEQIIKINDDNSDGANCLAIGDLDEDGDIDILSGFQNYGYIVNKFALYENLLIDLFIDLDNDGFDETEDCDDMNALINPCAIEIPGNGIDENCDDLDIVVQNTEIELQEEIKIFPNPTRDLVVIQSESSEVKTCRLYNSTGQLLQENSFKDQLQIDLRSSLDGIYFIQINANNTMNTYKIIKIQ